MQSLTCLLSGPLQKSFANKRELPPTHLLASISLAPKSNKDSITRKNYDISHEFRYKNLKQNRKEGRKELTSEQTSFLRLSEFSVCSPWACLVPPVTSFCYRSVSFSSFTQPWKAPLLTIPFPLPTSQPLLWLIGATSLTFSQ